MNDARAPATGTAGRRPDASLDAAVAAFLREHTAYASTRVLDDLRSEDYGRLDLESHTYLDYTAGSLYGVSQLREHMALLERRVLGNPHSGNPTSLEMTRMVDHCREKVLEYFNASSDEYVVVFTPNASGALKLVGESYPFGPGDTYLLTYDNHNSVNGIREYARARGAAVAYVPVLPPDLRVDDEKLEAALARGGPGGRNLFAYPAQSNFSGVQHALDWVERARDRGWDVILDAASFVSTNRLDLGLCRPDFVPISFYKVFGYPTGVGCLLARREALNKLRRPWFAGGTITVASVQGDRFYYAEGEAAFEDGTLNYLTLPAVEIGLERIHRIGIETIHARVMCLSEWLLQQLTALRHGSGAALAHVYGPVDTVMRGATIAFNFYDPGGNFIDHRWVEQRANEVNISLRTGCFCNPGEGEVALGLTREELEGCFVPGTERLTLDEFRRCIDAKSTGAVRVSLGLASNFEDVWRFLEFARTFLDRREPRT